MPHLSLNLHLSISWCLKAFSLCIHHFHETLTSRVPILGKLLRHHRNVSTWVQSDCQTFADPESILSLVNILDIHRHPLHIIRNAITQLSFYHEAVMKLFRHPHNAKTIILIVESCQVELPRPTLPIYFLNPHHLDLLVGVVGIGAGQTVGRCRTVVCRRCRWCRRLLTLLLNLLNFAPTVLAEVTNLATLPTLSFPFPKALNPFHPLDFPLSFPFENFPLMPSPFPSFPPFCQIASTSMGMLSSSAAFTGIDRLSEDHCVVTCSYSSILAFTSS